MNKIKVIIADDHVLFREGTRRLIEQQKDMEVIGKSLFAAKKYENYLIRMLPQKLQFIQLLDFARAGQILSIIFKEIVWGWEPKGKKGDFREYKDCLQVFLKQAPRELKKQFNRLGFYVGRKRVFIS